MTFVRGDIATTSRRLTFGPETTNVLVVNLGPLPAAALAYKIVVFEPTSGLSAELVASRDPPTRFGVPKELLAKRLQVIAKHVQYQPVMKFVAADGNYTVCRMTYRGDGGWSDAVGRGPLVALVVRYVGLIGTDEFFELG